MTGTRNPHQPFAGVRVVDFSAVFSGPYASAQLAMLGADVVKIERPEGDDARNMNPVTGPAGEATSTVFMSANMNKRSVALDLKRPEAVAAARRLIETADVVLENFRPGVMARLGLGPEELTAAHPQLIYCSVSGYGQEGPERSTASYDGRIQAASGLMSITGHPEHGPMRCGFAVIDAASGMTAAFAIASALFQRSHTGQGQVIDLAMFDTALSFMSPTVCDWTVGGIQPTQFGNQAISRRPTADLFPVRDGHLLLACNSEGQFRALCGVIGREDLLDDPRFVDWPARAQHRAELRAIIEAAFAEDDVASWERRLDEAGVPASRIRTIPEAVDHPQMAWRDAVVPFGGGHGSEGGFSLIGAGFRFAHDGPSIDQLPPAVGQHTEEVLREAGLTDAEIAAATGR